MDQINNQILGRDTGGGGGGASGRVLAEMFRVLRQEVRDRPIRKVALEEKPGGGSICPGGRRSGWADSRGKGPGAGLHLVPRWAITFYHLIY